VIQKKQNAFKLIEEAYHITIASHINPDGDTLGSMLGLGISLKQIGKKISYYNCEKNLPKKFDFLPSYKKIKSTQEVDWMMKI